MLAFEESTRTMVLLGEVDEVEVDAEGAHELLEANGGLGVDPVEESFFFSGVRLVAGAEVDGACAEALYVAEEVVAALFVENFADEFAEEADVVAQAVDGFGA